MKNHNSLGILLLLTASLLVQPATSSAATDHDKVTINLNWKAEPEFGGFYAAQLDGLDRKNKIELKVVEGGSGAPIVQMVAAGRADFGIASGDEILIARSRGADVVALFAVFQKNPQAIMVRDERPHKTLGEVFAAPGSIALNLGLPYVAFLQTRFKNIKAKLVPYAGGVASFLSDVNFSQQCFVGAEPLVAAKSGAKSRVFLVADEGFNPYTTVLIARRDFAVKNRNLTQRLVNLTRQGWMNYIKSPAATHAVIAKINPTMDLATSNATLAEQKPLIVAGEGLGKIGEMNQGRWAELATQLFELKLTRSVVDTTDLIWK